MASVNSGIQTRLRI